jgi:hypothetical protein
MKLKVTELTEDRIICGDYTFDRKTGAEIDEEIGWGPPPEFMMTGSFIKIPGIKYGVISDEEALKIHDAKTDKY